MDAPSRSRQGVMSWFPVIVILVCLHGSAQVTASNSTLSVVAQNCNDLKGQVAPSVLSVDRNKRQLPTLLPDGTIPGIIQGLSTSRGYNCDVPCSTFEGTSYFWCPVSFARHSWDYCSPQIGIDYYGRPCVSLCGFHGYQYKWCYTDNSQNWGYCSDQNGATGGAGQHAMPQNMSIFLVLLSIPLLTFLRTSE